MKITPRLTLLFLGLSLVPLGLLCLEFYRSGKSTLRKEVLDHLASTAMHLERHIDHDLRQCRSTLELVLISRTLGKCLVNHLVTGDAEARRQVGEALERVLERVREFRTITILDTSGRVIVERGPGEGPEPGILEESFARARGGKSAGLWVPGLRGLDLYLSAPIHVEGRVIAYAVARTAGLQLDSMAEYPRLSGWAIEPFLVTMRPDSSLQFILPTGTRVDSLGSGQARGGDFISAELLHARRDTLFPDLVDYRGVPVLAAVRFVESADWGLVVRMDQEQAYAPVRRFRNHTLVALAGVALAAMLVSLLVSRRLTRRLLELILIAREFSAGRLTRRATGCETRDELGELGQSLNAMAENLVSREELQAYIDQMSTHSAKLDLQGRVVMANRTGYHAFARPESDVIGRSFLLEPWYRCDAAVAERMRMAFAEARAGKPMSREETFLGDGKRVHLSITFSPVRDASGTVAYIIVEGRDVTALKDAQAALYEVNEGLEESVRERTESLQEALREKEMLLKEIHHRVKNNLQIISSLLSLQSVHVRDPEVAGILTESRNRVKSMALVHERLYAGDDLGNTGFTGYIRDLAAQLVRSSEAEGRHVHLEFDLEEIHVGLSQAIPCGLAIHELVANSLKHAFPGGRAMHGPPRVTIRSRALPEGGFELEVEDNGAGLPEGFDPRKSRTLGLQLVFTLIRQLKGVLETGRGGGTRMRIAIPGAE